MPRLIFGSTSATPLTVGTTEVTAYNVIVEINGAVNDPSAQAFTFGDYLVLRTKGNDYVAPMTEAVSDGRFRMYKATLARGKATLVLQKPLHDKRAEEQPVALIGDQGKWEFRPEDFGPVLNGVKLSELAA